MHTSYPILKLMGPVQGAAEKIAKRKGPIPDDLASMILLALFAMTFVLYPPFSTLPIRIPLGFVMVIFIPGYTLTAALFPRKDDLDIIERLALSVGLSVALVSMIGTGLDYTTWGIRLAPAMIVLTFFTISMAAVAYLRRNGEEKDVRFSARYKDVLEFLRSKLVTENTKGLDKILTLILMILMLTSASTLAYVAMMPTQGEKFTEFYILGPDGLADNYPTTKFAGDNCTVTAGIINHEYRVVNYTLLVESDNATLLQRDIKLNHNRTWNQPINYVLGNPGNKKELKFLLYYEGNFSKPYRELHLWVEPMYSKKIVIRDDDIWSMSYSLKWFTNLILEKGLKVTYAVIPGRVMTQPDTIHFLDSLDKKRFELATHGYLDSDNNKEKALFNLGYHSISSDRASDVNFTWEYYGNSKVTYRNFTEFKNYFDKFYNSSGEFFVMLLHDNAWVDQSGELNETVIEDFERSMDYVKSKKHIEFMTIEEQYQWTHGKR